MSAANQIRRMWAHSAWADDQLLSALRRAPTPPADALREYAHVLGAEEIWLARLEQRDATSAVWPTYSIDEAATRAASNAAAYANLLGPLTDDRLAESISYTNSAGQSFTTPIGDILLHVPLHGQYHRGKVNVLLRQHGIEPSPADYIAFVRGVPAATTPR